MKTSSPPRNTIARKPSHFGSYRNGRRRRQLVGELREHRLDGRRDRARGTRAATSVHGSPTTRRGQKRPSLVSVARSTGASPVRFTFCATETLDDRPASVDGLQRREAALPTGVVRSADHARFAIHRSVFAPRRSGSGIAIAAQRTGRCRRFSRSVYRRGGVPLRRAVLSRSPRCGARSARRRRAPREWRRASSRPP